MLGGGGVGFAEFVDLDVEERVTPELLEDVVDTVDDLDTEVLLVPEELSDDVLLVEILAVEVPDTVDVLLDLKEDDPVADDVGLLVFLCVRDDVVLLVVDPDDVVLDVILFVMCDDTEIRAEFVTLELDVELLLLEIELVCVTDDVEVVD